MYEQQSRSPLKISPVSDLLTEIHDRLESTNLSLEETKEKYNTALVYPVSPPPAGTNPDIVSSILKSILEEELEKILNKIEKINDKIAYLNSNCRL